MKNKLKHWFSNTQTYILLIVIVYVVIVSLVNPSFFTAESLFDLLQTSAGVVIVSLGVMLVLISGGIDVSFTVIAVFGAYSAARFMQVTGIDNLWVAFIIAIVIGAVLGMINALLIHLFRLPVFVVTLGTQSMFTGLMATIVGTVSINPSQCPRSLVDFGAMKIFTVERADGMQYGLSVFIIPMILLILLTWFILHRTMIGRGIVALGNSETSAIRAGFNLLKIRLFLFMYVGVLSAIMGIMAIAKVNSITPISNYMMGGMELTVIAAVVIGGTKLSGGRGTIFGTIVGITLIQLFSNTLIFLGLTTSWSNLFTGLVLVACLVGTSLQNRYRRRRLLLFDE